MQRSRVWYRRSSAWVLAVLMLLSVGVAVGFIHPAPSQAQERVIIVNAHKDTTVFNRFPNRNFGHRPRLVVGAFAGGSRVFVTFHVPRIDLVVDRATLVLHTIGRSGQINVRTVGSGWRERRLTSSRAPGGSSLVGAIPRTPRRGTAEQDVTPLIDGSATTVSFVLRSSGDRSVLASRQALTDHGPKIKIHGHDRVTGQPSPTPTGDPVTPSPTQSPDVSPTQSPDVSPSQDPSPSHEPSPDPTQDPPSPDPGPPIAAVRAAYGRDSSSSGVDVMRSVGLNTVTASPYRSTLDALANHGMKAIVWLGAYNRKVTQPCAFEHDDAWIRDRVASVAGNPAIVAYQITDEPDSSVTQCPNVVDQVRARAALVASLDPGTPTYVTISKSGYDYARWVGTVDILGLVIYPVSVRGYNESMIPTAIQQAQKAGVSRYWAVMQDFGTSNWYTVPTAAQLQHQFDQWAASPMQGYVIYHWNLGDVEQQPDQMSTISGVNGAW